MEGYANGSNFLVKVGGKAVGHCSTHSVKCSSETKEHAVKPVATAKKSSGLFKGKSVVGLSISISAEGFVFYNESETGYSQLLALWKAGKPVEVECFEREKDETPYLAGKFVLTDLEKTAPAQDDATYSISLDNDGEPETLDESKITLTDAA
jgi:predicted secreted protein